MQRFSLAFLLGSIFTVSHASAQVAEFSVSGGQSRVSPKELNPDYSLDDGFHLAFRLTLNNWVYFGHEFGYAYNRSHLINAGQSTGGMAIHQGFYDFLAYATKEGKRFRPFVAGGGHFSNFVPPGSSAAQGGGSNKFGYNYGGGVKMRLTDKWQVRADYRQYVTGKPFGNIINVSGSLRQSEISVGVGFVL